MCIHDPQTRTVRRNAYSAATRTTYTDTNSDLTCTCSFILAVYSIRTIRTNKHEQTNRISHTNPASK